MMGEFIVGALGVVSGAVMFYCLRRAAETSFRTPVDVYYHNRDEVSREEFDELRRRLDDPDDTSVTEISSTLCSSANRVIHICFSNAGET